MSESMRSLLDGLERDPWRERTPFEQEFVDVQNQLLRDGSSAEERAGYLGKWLERGQPCLFGRLAARRGLLHYCFLDSKHLAGTDEELQSEIQRERLAWRQAARRGEKSGFVIVLLSEQLALAPPSETVAALAQRLCQLYLVRDAPFDEVLHEDLFLEIPSRDRPRVIQWRAGVNYFSAQGDKRWWHDHRIPGGMAFSVNSVGHMVRSAQLKKALGPLEALTGEGDEWNVSKVESLDQALEWAMRTIHLAAPTMSGPATYLHDLAGKRPRLPCPVQLPAPLQGKDHCEYSGFYHTDHTLPTAYFRPHVDRPAEAEQFSLDFTYLFDRAARNPDHLTMGTGVRIAARRHTRKSDDTPAKHGKAWGVELSADASAEILARLDHT